MHAIVHQCYYIWRLVWVVSVLVSLDRASLRDLIDITSLFARLLGRCCECHAFAGCLRAPAQYRLSCCDVIEYEGHSSFALAFRFVNLAFKLFVDPVPVFQIRFVSQSCCSI